MINCTQFRCTLRLIKHFGSSIITLTNNLKEKIFKYIFFFFSRPLFEGDNEFCLCLKESFPNLKTRKLTRVEWGTIRRLMGKPRRYALHTIFSHLVSIFVWPFKVCDIIFSFYFNNTASNKIIFFVVPFRCSSAFFAEERTALRQKRQKMRLLQQGKMSDVSNCKDLPDEIPLRLNIGTKVTGKMNGMKTHYCQQLQQPDKWTIKLSSFSFCFMSCRKCRSQKQYFWL